MCIGYVKELNKQQRNDEIELQERADWPGIEHLTNTLVVVRGKRLQLNAGNEEKERMRPICANNKETRPIAHLSAY